MKRAILTVLITAAAVFLLHVCMMGSAHAGTADAFNPITDGNQERMSPGGLECWRIGQFMARWGKLRTEQNLQRDHLVFAPDWNETERRDLNALADAFWNNDYYGFKKLVRNCTQMPRA